MRTSEKVLRILEEGRGQYLSGEEIADRLSLSRNAVWKAVSSLKNEGYEIASQTKRGYCLLKTNDILSAAGILKELKADFPDGEVPLEEEQIQIYPTVSSTNQEAICLAAEEAEGMQLVIADTQSKGRGHQKHTFLSPKGGIYMSLLLHPEDLPFATESSAILTAYGAVSVAKAIEQKTGYEIQIKWVNDLFLDRKKVCGILTEAGSDFESGHLKWIVIGIGINFSTGMSDFPEDLQKQVTSLYPSDQEEKGEHITRNELIAQILKELLRGSGQAEERDENLELLLEEYRKRLLYIGEKRTLLPLSDKMSSFSATLKGVDEEGRLVVLKEDGEEEKLSFSQWTVEH
jgi:BirA family transcriptional regulator, biotin operon repressor / biotin---[acetyl-CoA-carboxylase] ligase